MEPPMRSDTSEPPTMEPPMRSDTSEPPHTRLFLSFFLVRAHAHVLRSIRAQAQLLVARNATAKMIKLRDIHEGVREFS